MSLEGSCRELQNPCEDMALLLCFLSIAPRTIIFGMEKQKVKGKFYVFWNAFDLSDGTNDDDVMVIPGLVVHARPLDTNLTTLSNLQL